MRQRRSSPRRQERGEKPPATNRALSALLDICDVQQQELAEVADRKPGTLSDYARRKKLSLKNYWALTAFLTDRPAAEQLLALVEAIDRDDELSSATPAALVPELESLAGRLAASLPGKVEELAAQRERQKFQVLWTALRHLTVDEWEQLIEALPGLRSPAFVERLAEESARAASDDADRALELANLALWLARKVPGKRAAGRAKGLPGASSATRDGSGAICTRRGKPSPSRPGSGRPTAPALPCFCPAGAFSTSKPRSGSTCGNRTRRWLCWTKPRKRLHRAATPRRDS